MSSSRPLIYVAAILFLAVAAVALYRLLFWFPITIGRAEIGQTASFFTFVICVALGLMLFRGGMRRD